MSTRRIYSAAPSPRIRDLLTGGGSAWREPLPRTCPMILTGSCRSAIRLGLGSMDVGEGDDILVPSYHCGSEIDAILSSGASVTPYRIDGAAQIDLEDLESRIGSTTRAIYLTHFYGFPADTTGVRSLCDQRNLFLIQDCAHSIFCTEGNDPVASDADLAVYSLSKSLPVPCGGLACSPIGTVRIQEPARSVSPGRLNYASMFKRMSIRAMARLGLRLHARAGGGAVADIPGTDPEFMPEHYRFNADLDADRAAPRLSCRILGHVDPSLVVHRRRYNYNRLHSSLRKVPGIELVLPEAGSGTSPLVCPVRSNWLCRRVWALRSLGVEATRFWLGRHPSIDLGSFPEVEVLKEQVVGLPVHQAMSNEQIDFIAHCIGQMSREQ
ncbi:MAG: hypothetical protein CMJ32_02040 [Phycisphaerae bacterium]|nr:hypothetical protein [Phycisphaerae bacterium]